jgi:hypothetical protein
MPFPAALIYTCHATPLPFSDSAVSFVKVRVIEVNIRTASEIGMLLVTTFVELRVVAGRSRTRAGRPIIIYTYHAVSLPLPCRAVPWPWEVAFGTAWSWHGMAWERHGPGMVCVNQTRPLCVNKMEQTQSKPLAERHGNGIVCVYYPKPDSHIPCPSRAVPLPR